MQKSTDNYFFKFQWTRIHQFMIYPVNNSILIIHLTIRFCSYQINNLFINVQLIELKSYLYPYHNTSIHLTLGYALPKMHIQVINYLTV